MGFTEKYETIIGLEIHVQLATESKLFSGDSFAFGAAPNSQISAITLAHPGTLPRLNQKAVDLAVRMGLACHCEIAHHNFFARKNYTYPDLPKGYQLSQHTVPICKGGYVAFRMNNAEHTVQLNRIHLEEDAGKSVHDIDPQFSGIDYNRAGTPLIEIVTEPAITSAEEACLYVTAIRQLVRWIGVSDGNMERGNLRCDANISIRRRGEALLGTKVEVKNLNSIRNLRKAIEFEVNRMCTMLEAGEKIVQQTRSFNAADDTTFAMRDKEDANDYRYFPDPDLAPFELTTEKIAAIRAGMPELPASVFGRLREEFGLNDYDALQVTEEKDLVDYFFSTAGHTKNYKAIANWVNGPVKQYLNETGSTIKEFPLLPAQLAELVDMVESGSISFSAASAKMMPAMISTGKEVHQLVAELNLSQVSNEDDLSGWITIAIEKMPDKVSEYKKGKKGLMGLFVGEVKKLSKGKADLKLVTELLEQRLKN